MHGKKRSHLAIFYSLVGGQTYEPRGSLVWLSMELGSYFCISASSLIDSPALASFFLMVWFVVQDLVCNKHRLQVPCHFPESQAVSFSELQHSSDPKFQLLMG